MHLGLLRLIADPHSCEHRLRLLDAPKTRGVVQPISRAGRLQAALAVPFASFRPPLTSTLGVNMHYLLRNTLVSVGLALAALTVHSEPIGKLNIQGTEHQPTCSGEDWHTFRKQVEDAAGNRKPDQLVNLVGLLLCGSGTTDTRKLHWHVPKRISLSGWETGTEGTSYAWINRSEITPFEGRVWDANAISVDTRVRVFFAGNEACVRSFDFSYIKESWLVVAQGDACD
jgi:hypothetical protein